jgi:hypothetical protein
MIGPARDGPRLFPPQARHLVVRVACQEERARDFSGFSHNSVRDVARLGAGRGAIMTMRPATVQRMLAAMVRKPPRVRSWLTRPDPECEPKREEMGTRSVDPPRHRRLRCLDEQTGMHALARLYPTVPGRPGQLARRECESVRHGVGAWLAAFDGRPGQVFGPCDQRHTHRELRHFRRAWRGRDPDRRWHLRVDNASDHQPQEGLEGCAAQRPKIVLPWWPDHGSWLNQVDIWFSSLSRTGLRRAHGGSTRERRDLIHRFIKTGKTHVAHPFQWTSTGTPLAASHQQCDLTAA